MESNKNNSDIDEKIDDNLSKNTNQKYEAVKKRSQKLPKLVPFSELLKLNCCKHLCTKYLLTEFEYFNYLRIKARISQNMKREAARELINSQMNYRHYCVRFMTLVIGISRGTLGKVMKNLRSKIHSSWTELTGDSNHQLNNMNISNSSAQLSMDSINPDIMTLFSNKIPRVNIEQARNVDETD